MNWNDFMEALAKSGVSEITLKFNNNREMPIVGETDVTDNKVVVKSNPNPVSAQTQSTKTKTTRKDRLITFRTEKPGWHTVHELSEATGFGISTINLMIRTYGVPSDSYGRCTVYDTETLYLKRQEYEDDIMKHDGERPGGVKFIADKILTLLNK